MKKILISVIVPVLLSLQANGQKLQDTLYLKNGDRAVGKLLEQSVTEYRFRSSDGLYFTFSPDDVDKVVIAQKMIMSEVLLDTLNIDQLNLYRHKAVKMRNTGRALTLSGAGVFATGFVLGIIMMNTSDDENPHDDMNYLIPGFYAMFIGGLTGISFAAVGIPLWATGGSRKTKAELALKKFNLPANPMAAGVGITIRF